MKIDEFLQRFHITRPALSFTRVIFEDTPPDLDKGCIFQSALHRAFDGEVIHLTTGSGVCRGANTGLGLVDGLPAIPGGFGYFISYGAGEGFPPGERIKCNPEVAEKMLLDQPQKVMDGFNAVRVKQWEPADNADTVCFLVNPDSLSGLIHLFNFRRSDYDNIIAPMTSGCASLFRIPFGEMLRESHRAVIGNVDITSRPHFDADTFFFTVSNSDFLNMLDDAEESIIAAPYWKRLEKRISPTLS